MNYKNFVIKISSERNYLAFLLLIGGESKRFGEDKGLFKIKDKQLIEYQIDVLKEFKYDIFLVAHSRHQIQEYINNINYKDITGFIIDELNEFFKQDIRSPMLGLYSSFKELRKHSYQKGFAISCDMPFIQLKVIEFLINKSFNYDCCIPIWKNKYIEPLFAIYPIKKGFYSARENLSKKKYKLTNLIKPNWKVNYISIEKTIKNFDQKLLTFININKKKDLEKISLDLKRKNKEKK
ncbi:MAG: molybdenum cofactor guanylyltransferase [Promethearchaeota archaeon]|nr:MAG: molybdenum cofactor guanylyltransferase [Candidatus Lokiarchaeota archaeon]